MQYLASDETWEPLSTNYKKVIEAFGAPPVVGFVDDPSRSGTIELEVIDSKLVPVMRLRLEDDPLESLITLNHEINHAVSLATRKIYLGDATKLKGCVTKYKLMTLEDESPAFKSELQFWRAAPANFNEHFKGKAFHSRLIGSTGDYDAYYERLGSLMAKEPNFISRRYVEMGEYPACVLKLIK